MSRKSYKYFDICVLTIIACIIEGVLTWASNNFKFEGFTVSFALLFSLIAMIRWNYLGIIPALGATFINYVVQTAVVPNSYLTSEIIGMMVGALTSVLTCLMFKKIPKEKITGNIGYLALYCSCSYAIYIVVAGIVTGIISQKNPLGWTQVYFSRNVINLFMTYVVMIVASKQRAFLVDMNKYLDYLHNTPSSARIREELHEDKEHSIMSEVNDSDEVNDIALLDGGMLSEEDLIELNKTFKEKEGEKSDGTRKS